MSYNSLRLKLLFTIGTCVHIVLVVAVLHQNFDDFPWCFALIGFLLIGCSPFCSLFIILHDLFGLWVSRCSFHFGINGFSLKISVLRFSPPIFHIAFLQIVGNFNFPSLPNSYIARSFLIRKIREHDFL